MKTPVILETYRDTEIAFSSTDAWVNVTPIAKAFKKRPAKFLELPSTEAYMAALAADLEKSDVRKSDITPVMLVRAVKGNHSSPTEQGTWMHPDLAMEFARWLSPEFSIWCNRVIRRILSGESVEVKRENVDHIAAGFASLTRMAEGMAETQRMMLVAQQRMEAELREQAERQRFAATTLSMRVSSLERRTFGWADGKENVDYNERAHAVRHRITIDDIAEQLARLFLAALGERQQAFVGMEEFMAHAKAAGLEHYLAPIRPAVSLGGLLVRLDGKTVGGIHIRRHRSARHRGYILTRGVTAGAN